MVSVSTQPSNNNNDYKQTSALAKQNQEQINPTSNIDRSILETLNAPNSTDEQNQKMQQFLNEYHSVEGKKNFRNMDLSYLNLSEYDLRGAKLSRAVLTGATLPLNLQDTNFIECDLSGRDFSKSNLEGANLNGAILTGMKLPDNLQKVLLAFCNLSERDLSKANLTQAQFYRTNLTKTRLPNKKPKNLPYCYLTETDLSNANLRKSLFNRN